MQPKQPGFFRGSSVVTLNIFTTPKKITHKNSWWDLGLYSNPRALNRHPFHSWSRLPAAVRFVSGCFDRLRMDRIWCSGRQGWFGSAVSKRSSICLFCADLFGHRGKKRTNLREKRGAAKNHLGSIYTVSFYNWHLKGLNKQGEEKRAGKKTWEKPCIL